MFRLVTNFAMDSQLVLSLLFVGQPPLAELLRQKKLEDLAQRIAHFVVLRPLSRAETQQYITHRCTVAGAVNTPFDDTAVHAMFTRS